MQTTCAVVAVDHVTAAEVKDPTEQLDMVFLQWRVNSPEQDQI